MKFGGKEPLRGAFTILELLVVIRIIAILGALAVPVYARVTHAGKATACVSHLRQLGVALNLYLGENQMIMPTIKAGRSNFEDEGPVIDTLLGKYLNQPAVFACPADSRWAQETGTSCHWNVALNGQSTASLNFLNLVVDHSHIPIFGDKEGFHPYLESRVNILYADGHASKGCPCNASVRRPCWGLEPFLKPRAFMTISVAGGTWRSAPRRKEPPLQLSFALE